MDDLIQRYQLRCGDIAEAISLEMGAPRALAGGPQFQMGLAHLRAARAALETYAFEQPRGSTLILHEPIGVCGFITPWNWPMNQMLCKVAPALATGCTMVLKPSENAALSARIWAEIVDDAQLPPGVFNMVQGDALTSTALVAHPDVDMISFTGSTQTGVAVAQGAATTVKRVTQELGGKSPNILLDDADFDALVPAAVAGVMLNSGQTCAAATRLIVPAERLAQVEALAREAALNIRVGGRDMEDGIGPVVSRRQWERIQRYIGLGVAEGARIIAGGPGRPEGLSVGFYVKPTIFSSVRNDMSIAREEIFGPVLAILPFGGEEEAIEIANDTSFGLAARVSSGDLGRARRVARRLRAGQVTINEAPLDLSAPFGGYKQSGNGREWGGMAFAEYLEIKAVVGHQPVYA